MARLGLTIHHQLLPGFPGLILLVSLGCSTVVTPPADPEDPVPAFLVDYGRHTSLVMPRQDGSLVEYAWGDWSWFALDNDDWFVIPITLLIPTRATLGRRSISAEATVDDISARIPSEQVFQIAVSARDRSDLLADLDAHYRQYEDTEVYSDRYDLWFVHDNRSYTVWSNCNHQTAKWLEQLGCEVRGSAMFATFSLDH